MYNNYRSLKKHIKLLMSRKVVVYRQNVRYSNHLTIASSLHVYSPVWIHPKEKD